MPGGLSVLISIDELKTRIVLGEGGNGVRVADLERNGAYKRGGDGQPESCRLGDVVCGRQTNKVKARLPSTAANGSR